MEIEITKEFPIDIELPSVNSHLDGSRSIIILFRSDYLKIQVICTQKEKKFVFFKLHFTFSKLI